MVRARRVEGFPAGFLGGAGQSERLVRGGRRLLVQRFLAADESAARVGPGDHVPRGRPPALTASAGVPEVRLDQADEAVVDEVDGAVRAAGLAAARIDLRVLPGSPSPEPISGSSPFSVNPRCVLSAKSTCFGSGLGPWDTTDAWSVRSRRTGSVSLVILLDPCATRCGSASPFSTERSCMLNQVYVPPRHSCGSRATVLSALSAAAFAGPDGFASVVPPSADEQPLTHVRAAATIAAAAPRCTRVRFMVPPPWSVLPVEFTGGHGPQSP